MAKEDGTGPVPYSRRYLLDCILPWRLPMAINKHIIMYADFAELHLVASDYQLWNAPWIFSDLIASYKWLITLSGMDMVNIATMVTRICRLVNLMHMEDWFLNEHGDFVGTLLRHVDSNVNSFRAAQISGIVLALGRLGHKVRLIRTTDGVSGNEVLQKLVLASRLNARYFGDRNWASMLVGLALLSPPSFADRTNEGEADVASLMAGVDSSHSHQSDLPSLHDPVFLRVAVDHICRTAPMFDSRSLTRTIWAFAALDYRECVSVVHFVLKRMELDMRSFHISQVSLILWSLAQLHMSQTCSKRPFAIQRAIQLCMSRIQESDPHDLNHLVWGLTGLQIGWCSGLFDVVVDETLRKVRQSVKFTDADVVGLMFSFARYQYLPHSTLLSKTVEYVKENVDELEPPLLSKVLYFFAIFGLADTTVIEVAKKRMAHRMQGATRHDTATFAWSLAMLDELDVDFLRLASRHLSQINSSSAELEGKLASQVYQCVIHLQHVAKLDIPQGTVPEDVLECGRKEWELRELARGLPSCGEGALEVLARLGYRVKRRVLIAAGPTLVSIAIDPHGTHVAVESVLRTHCFVNDEKTIPHSHMWRARLLEALGLKVLLIKDTEWVMAGDQKARFVMRKLGELQQNDFQEQRERSKVVGAALASAV